MTELKIKEFLKNHGTMLWIIFWYTALLISVILWARYTIANIEPQVIVETKFVYVYQEKDLPEEIIEEPEPQLRYGFTDGDIYLMTVLLCGSGKTDGDGEYDIDFAKNVNHDQVSLVLSVVMNRVMSDKFPNAVSEVIWAPGQFSPMPRWKQRLPIVSDKSYQIVKEWCEAYDSHDLSVMSIPESHLYFAGNGIINRSRERW